jgi:hypothetical protein
VNRREFLALALPTLPRADRDLLDDLQRRGVLYFWEQADPRTGLVRDRARNTGVVETSRERNIGSIAATGFGLTALCIAHERKWLPRDRIVARVRTTLDFFANRAFNQHGWFWHFMDAATGERSWKCEISSIDTALLLGGVLSVRQYFPRDPEIARLATTIYERVDFRWMLNQDPLLLSHGWRPEEGFLRSRWDHHCELMILYLLAIGSPAHPIPPEAWYAWRRDTITYAGFTYISGAPPLFVHQYAHAWIDFRGRRDTREPRTDWFQNSVLATRAHRQFCIDLAAAFPKSYSENVWGITASDSAKGYVAWGGPPRDPAIDGSVVPCAPAGSLIFTPDICIPAIRTMRDRFGDRIYGRYGFLDAFNPATGWADQDVIGIDVGISVLSAANTQDGSVWRWFMANPEIQRALDACGLRQFSYTDGLQGGPNARAAAHYRTSRHPAL